MLIVNSLILFSAIWVLTVNGRSLGDTYHHDDIYDEWEESDQYGNQHQQEQSEEQGQYDNQQELWPEEPEEQWPEEPGHDDNQQGESEHIQSSEINRGRFEDMNGVGYSGEIYSPSTSGYRDENPELGKYYEGDIIGYNEDDESGDWVGEVAKDGLRDENLRWPKNTVIYNFDQSFSNAQRGTFVEAMKHISERTCIRFKQRTNEDAYVQVMNNGPLSGCLSNVGKIGGRQKINLADGCSRGTMVHELIHTIGFFHVQSRTDRDKFVKIHWENIDQIHTKNFVMKDRDEVSRFGVDYDYSSIMHYPSYAFSNNGKDTITPIGRGVGVKLGQRKEMTAIDALKINRMYKCGGISPQPAPSIHPVITIVPGKPLKPNPPTTFASVTAVKIQNMANQQSPWLDVENYHTVDGKAVITWPWNGGDNQKWKINWGQMGSETTFESFSQHDIRGTQVMTEDCRSNNVLVRKYLRGSQSNQIWILKKAPNVMEQWTIVNKQSRRCLTSEGGRAKTINCNSNDNRQLWKIHNLDDALRDYQEQSEEWPGRTNTESDGPIVWSDEHKSRNPWREEPDITIQEDDEPGFTIQEDDEPGFRIQEDDEPGFTIQEDDEPGFTIQEDDEPGFTIQEDDEPGFTIQEDGEPGFTIQEDDEPGFTIQEDDEPGFTIQEDDEPSFTIQEDGEPGFTIQEDDEPDFTIRERDQYWAIPGQDETDSTIQGEDEHDWWD